MYELIVENIRCFRDLQRVPLRPLTLLVGENSTGKSTMLALIRAAWHLAQGPAGPDFNESPYLLGAYEQIAHFHGGRGKRATSFKLGVAYQAPGSPAGPATELTGTFGRGPGDQPALVGWRIDAGQYSVEVELVGDGTVAIAYTAPSGRLKITEAGPADIPAPVERMIVLPLLRQRQLTLFRPRRGAPEQREILEDSRSPLSADDVDTLSRLPLSHAKVLGSAPPFAGAPVRSRPHRTYDPVREQPEPEGGHVPMRMASLRDGEARIWKSLVERLRAFGQPAGLMEGVDVRRKGKKPSDPFQIHVKVDRFGFNLTDVGYGVSQALPILVDTVLAPRGTTFLLQQPEVHLHPRAQAELATFLGRLVCEDRKRFIVETHSDYLVDRLCLDVREQTVPGLTHDQVMVLYFEREANNVAVHAIPLSPEGELVGAPDGYRRFFLQEQRRMLGA
ncbi:MAG: AAA family ATPase [Deltaproteobacteria bacterium]|nr:AAA family ATPase [Deltaproteobacteria bacterium]